MKISLKVKTKQKVGQLEKLENGDFLAKVRALPTKGQANLEIIELVANYFEVTKDQVKIKSGHFATTKIIEISTQNSIL